MSERMTLAKMKQRESMRTEVSQQKDALTGAGSLAFEKVEKARKEGEQTTELRIKVTKPWD